MGRANKKYAKKEEAAEDRRAQRGRKARIVMRNTGHKSRHSQTRFEFTDVLKPQD
jgi:hypothetical protein